MVNISDVATVVSGGTPKTSVSEYWGDDVVWITPKDLSSTPQLKIRSSEKMISNAGLQHSSARSLPAGTVVMSSRAPIGYVGVLAVPGATNQGCKNFIPGDQIDSRYLAFYLASRTEMLQQMGTGATFKEISAKRAADIPVPLPPLAEQQRIAAILDEAHTAVAKEQESIGKVEEVLRHIVPSTDKTVSVKHYVNSIVSGKSMKEYPTDGGPRVLKISAVTSGFFKPKEAKPLDPSYSPPEKHRVKKGDLLVSRANTTELVGASALVEEHFEDLLLPDKLWRLVPNDDVNPYFLWGCLQMPQTRRDISQASSGSGGSMKNITQSDFLDIQLPSYSAAQQNHFGELIRGVFEQRNQRVEKLHLLQELYASLSARAFAGELEGSVCASA